MTQQIHPHHIKPHLQAVDESWQGFFGPSEANPLDGWTTDQLLAEVLKRTADDGPALRRMQATMIQTLLTALDRESASGRG